MAHYAKISNNEFTTSERDRLKEAKEEKSVIEDNNRLSEEYATLKTAYDNSFTSATLQTLEGELVALQAQYTSEMTEEERTALDSSVAAKQAEIDTEKAALVPGQETALTNLKAKEAEGTEDLTAEIETLNTAIANALCRVTQVFTGAEEIEMVDGDSSVIDAEIMALEDSKKDVDRTQDEEVWRAEVEAIQVQIRAKLEEKKDIPQVEKDNTVYWEGYYGGCKRTSYNTQGGEHKLGGTPFRKNYTSKGDLYDPVRDAFYVEQPYASWTLNESTCSWEAPTPQPEGFWYWKEDTTEWVDYVYLNPDNKQPYPSWVWDTSNGGWNPPEGYPENYHPLEWKWNESNQQWEEKI